MKILGLLLLQGVMSKALTALISSVWVKGVPYLVTRRAQSPMFPCRVRSYR